MQEPTGAIVAGAGVWTNLATAFISALLGFLGAVAVFRSQFAVIDTKREALEKQIERDREADKMLAERELGELRRMLETTCEAQAEFYKRIERRQQVNLELIAAMAMKAGVSHRALGADNLARLVGDSMTEE